MVWASAVPKTGSSLGLVSRRSNVVTVSVPTASRRDTYTATGNPRRDSVTALHSKSAAQKEAEAIRAKIPQGASVVAMCVEGKMRSSEELAKMVADWSMNSAKHLVFVIGGSYGMHPSIKAEAWAQLSMSPMTFPHHLARVMVLEQIYRAFKINEGSSYHK